MRMVKVLREILYRIRNRKRLSGIVFETQSVKNVAAQASPHIRRETVLIKTIPLQEEWGFPHPISSGLLRCENRLKGKGARKSLYRL